MAKYIVIPPTGTNGLTFEADASRFVDSEGGPGVIILSKDTPDVAYQTPVAYIPAHCIVIHESTFELDEVKEPAGGTIDVETVR